MKKYFAVLLLIPISFIAVSVGCVEKNTQTNTKSYELILMQRMYNRIKTIDNETEKIIKQDEDGKNILSYVGLFTNDSISLFNYNDLNLDPLESNSLYTSQNSGNKLILKYINHSEPQDSLVYSFDKEQLKVLVNDNTYFLNQNYFEYLYKEGFEKNNIILLLGLFNSMVEDYSAFNELIDNFSKKYFSNTDFKILKSDIYTQSPHSDMKYHWNVSYLYNNDELIEIKKTPVDESDSPYFEQKLLTTNPKTKKYSVHWADDGDRFSEIGELFVNINTKEDSLCMQREQGGHIFTYQQYLLQRKIYPATKLNLSKDEILNIIKPDLIVSKEED